MKTLEKQIRKYAIATLSSPTCYLKSLHFGRYCFIEDIEGATKFLNKKLANKMIFYYIADTGDSDVELVVMGLPYNMDGTVGDRIVKTKEFGDLLKQTLNLPIEYVDERLSSVEAEDILAEAHVPAIKRKGLIDKIAAGIILQNYLNSRN